MEYRITGNIGGLVQSGSNNNTSEMKSSWGEPEHCSTHTTGGETGSFLFSNATHTPRIYSSNSDTHTYYNSYTYTVRKFLHGGFAHALSLN